MTTPLPPFDEIIAIIDAHLDREGPLLPILHDLQAAFDHVPPQSHGPICDRLNISKAELHGVISFYHDFHEAPLAPRIQLCRAEACKALGVDDLAQAAHSAGIETQTVYCLGLCACGPAARIGDRLVARVDLAKLTQLAGELA